MGTWCTIARWDAENGHLNVSIYVGSAIVVRRQIIEASYDFLTVDGGRVRVECVKSIELKLWEKSNNYIYCW